MRNGEGDEVIENLKAVDKKPREYYWTVNPSGLMEWNLRCEWKVLHGAVRVTPMGLFQAWTRKTLSGLEPEFDTRAEAVQWVMDTLGLEVQE